MAKDRSTYHSEYCKQNRTRFYWQDIFRKHGITEDDYRAMWRDQGGNCGICETPMAEAGMGTDRAHVDHDHATGRVRGLLCAGCNRGIGCLRESPTILMKAITYLQTPNK